MIGRGTAHWHLAGNLMWLLPGKGAGSSARCEGRTHTGGICIRQGAL